MRDDRLEDRNWVRIECVSPFDKVKVDEAGTLPGWFDEDRADIESRVMEFAQALSLPGKTFEDVSRAANIVLEESEKGPSAIYVADCETARKAHDVAVAPAKEVCRKKIQLANDARDDALEAARQAFDNAKWWHFGASAGDRKRYAEATYSARKSHNDAVFKAMDKELDDSVPAMAILDATIELAREAEEKAMAPANEIYEKTVDEATNAYNKEFVAIASKHSITIVKIDDDEDGDGL